MKAKTFFTGNISCRSLVGMLILLAAVLVLSCCSAEAAIQEVIGGTATSPEFLDCRAISSTELSFSFSRPVRVVTLSLDPDIEILSYREGAEIVITLSEPLKAGEMITADILVEDANRNTLNVLIPFRARNDKVPTLVINELRTEYSGPANKVEFVEFLAKSAGNMGALRLFIAQESTTQPIYEFPPVEVKAGEYIVLHLRTIEEGCVDETGSDLALSGGTDSSPAARDLWVPRTAEPLRKTDIVYLVDQDDTIIDAVLLSEEEGSSWGSSKKQLLLAEAAEFIASQGAWFPQGREGMAPGTYVLTPSDAVMSKSSTTTRSINRDQTQGNSRSAENWYILTTNNSNTPGKQNNPKK